jgi:ethanolamine utilization protein EutP (predicted NTPase)
MDFQRSSNMTDTQIVKVDQGAVNDRILAKEVKADFRRVEAASVKMMTHFTSAEAKRLFVRFFSTLQLNSHFVSVIARTKLKHEDIERVEAALRERLESVTDDLNKSIDGAEALFKNNGITSFATYDTKPLELEVGIISSSGRRYFEVLTKFDQLMPLLQTLEIHEVITPRDADIQRAGMKRAIRSIAGSARNLATGLRRRMNEFSAKEIAREQSMNTRRPGSGVTDEGQASSDGNGLDSGAQAFGDQSDARVGETDAVTATDVAISAQIELAEKKLRRKTAASPTQSEAVEIIEN